MYFPLHLEHLDNKDHESPEPISWGRKICGQTTTNNMKSCVSPRCSESTGSKTCCLGSQPSEIMELGMVFRKSRRSLANVRAAGEAERAWAASQESRLSGALCFCWYINLFSGKAALSPANLMVLEELSVRVSCSRTQGTSHRFCKFL